MKKSTNNNNNNNNNNNKNILKNNIKIYTYDIKKISINKFYNFIIDHENKKIYNKIIYNL